MNIRIIVFMMLVLEIEHTNVHVLMHYLQIHDTMPPIPLLNFSLHDFYMLGLIYLLQMFYGQPPQHSLNNCYYLN